MINIKKIRINKMTEENKEIETEVVKENQEPESPAFKEMARKEALIKRIVAPHKKVSRPVTEADIDRVIAEVKVLHEICFSEIGHYRGAYAMHHSQIDNEDPMNFFVTQDRNIIINPVITRHSGYTVDSKEACMSYSDRAQIIVPRWHKTEVEYTTIMVDPENKDKFKLSSVQKDKLSGHISFIFQHEVDHGNAQFIFIE